MSVSFLVLVLPRVLTAAACTQATKFSGAKTCYGQCSFRKASERRLLLCGEEEHGQDYCKIVSWL